MLNKMRSRTDYKNLIVFLLIFGLFLGATIEISEGSIPVGILLFILAIFLISRIKVGKSYVISRSKIHMFAGILIVIADIAYNVVMQSKLGTLDIMTFLLGVSLIAYDINNEEISRMGKFGTYMAATFIALFLLFFSILYEYLHLFDHYFVLLPSVAIIKAVGIPIHVVARETVKFHGVEDMSIVIGGPCSGLYSMFLLIGIMVAYTRIEYVERRKFFSLLIIAIAVAYIANLMRVVTLYIVGYYYGEDLMYTVHVHLGWVIFVIVVAVLLHLLENMRLKRES